MPWYADIMNALSGQAVAVFRSAVSSWLNSSLDFKQLKNTMRDYEKQLDKNEGGGLGSTSEIEKVKRYIRDFKDYKKDAKSASDFTGILRILSRYTDLANNLADDHPAVFNHKFKESVKNICDSTTKFVKSCQEAVAEMEKAEDYEKIVLGLLNNFSAISGSIRSYLKTYLQQKSVRNAFDIAKFCFAAIALGNEGGTNPGLLAQCLSKALNFTLGQLQKKRDKLLKEAKKRRAGAAAAAAAAAEGEE